MTRADDETIKYATRSFPQARAEDFQRSGKVWVDRATGTQYRMARGAPLLSDDPSSQADVFLVIDGQLVFLIRADRSPLTKCVPLGWVGGWQGA